MHNVILTFQEVSKDFGSNRCVSQVISRVPVASVLLVQTGNRNVIASCATDTLEALFQIVRSLRAAEEVQNLQRSIVLVHLRGQCFVTVIRNVDKKSDSYRAECARQEALNHCPRQAYPGGFALCGCAVEM